jgi:hypothetical protein
LVLLVPGLLTTVLLLAAVVSWMVVLVLGRRCGRGFDYGLPLLSRQSGVPCLGVKSGLFQPGGE